MKLKQLCLTLVAGVLLNGLETKAITTTTGFGSIPGAAANAYSGSGIPQDTSTYTQTSGLSGGDILTLSLAATQHGSSNPAPGNNGIDTYYVGTGLNAGRSLWNFDLYGRSDSGSLSGYSFVLTEKSDRTGLSFSFNPLLIPDNVGGPGAFGNSESLDFASFGGPIGYNPLLDDTFHFTLSGFVDGRSVGCDSITVIDGNGATVPDGGATGLMVGAGFLGLVSLSRRKFAVQS